MHGGYDDMSREELVELIQSISASCGGRDVEVKELGSKLESSQRQIDSEKRNAVAIANALNRTCKELEVANLQNDELRSVLRMVKAGYGGLLDKRTEEEIARVVAEKWCGEKQAKEKPETCPECGGELSKLLKRHMSLRECPPVAVKRVCEHDFQAPFDGVDVKLYEMCQKCGERRS